MLQWYILCAYRILHILVALNLYQHATHAPTNHQIIWSTSYHHVTVLVHWSWPHLLFTVVSVYRRQVLLKLHHYTRSLASKPLTCPSHLQSVRQARSCLDLLHLNHMTQCHVSYAMSSSIITCASFSTSPSHFHLHGICCSHTCTCGLITYVSHINTISPPKLSLNYQNQTRTFQSLDLESTSVAVGWHSDMVAPLRSLIAYWRCERNNLLVQRVMEMPRKWWSAPRSVIANSKLRHAVMWHR
jgi:hypothetical protein